MVGSRYIIPLDPTGDETYTDGTPLRWCHCEHVKGVHHKGGCDRCDPQYCNGFWDMVDVVKEIERDNALELAHGES